MIILSFLIYYALQSVAHAVPESSTFTSGRELPLASGAPACTCPQLRSTWDILWGCLATIFTCTWVSIHPNSPGPNTGRVRVILQRFELMVWAILIPEMIIFWALRQWLGARKLATYYEAFGWTTVQGHFLQMGGFMLTKDGHDIGVLDDVTFRRLLEIGRIRFPRVSEEEINALSKGDGLSKMIAIGQTSWFIAQCIARTASRLVVTQLELITVAFAFLNAFIYFLWWNKPLDASSVIRVPLCSNLIPVLVTHDDSNASRKSMVDVEDDGLSCRGTISHGEEQFIDVNNSQRRGRDMDVEHSSSDSTYVPPDGQTHERPSADTGLLSEIYAACSLLPSGIYIIVKETLGRIQEMRSSDGSIHPGAMHVPTFYATSEIADSIGDISRCLAIALIGIIFGAIHCAGWNIAAPSKAEIILWRINSGLILAYPAIARFILVLAVGSYRIWLSRRIIAFLEWMNKGVRTWGILMRCLPIYLLARMVLLVEALLALRNLPEGALVQVAWTRFLPHI